MPVCEKTPSLLDHLAASLGHYYLSALRDEALRPALYHAVLACSAQGWPLRDWQDTFHYLTGQNTAPQSSEEARTLLLDALRPPLKGRR